MFIKLKNNLLGGFFTVLFAALLTLTPAVSAASAPAAPINAAPLSIVNAPQKYLNKTVKMKATFDKFSTLGLDYKKALRPSSDYIGFLIQRDDVVDHNVPLSEMKLFIKRDYAEKFIELDTGDKIEITGKVFSDALGDSWVDVSKITITQKKPKADKK